MTPTRFHAALLTIIFFVLTIPVRADTFGQTTIGSTAYPTSGYEKVASLYLPDAYGIVESQMDETNNVLYARTNTQILKIPLPMGAGPITAVQSTDLDFALNCFAIDPANGYIYAGTGSVPGRIVKFAMGAGYAAPTRIGSTLLNSGESPLYSITLDTANGYAYAGTDSNPGRIIKVRMGAGAAPPVRVGSVTLSPGEVRVQHGVANATEGFALFAVYNGSSDTRAIKVLLGTGDAAPVRVAGSTAVSGFTNGFDADVASNTCYISVSSSTQLRVHKYNMGLGSNLPSLLGTFTLAIPSSGDIYNVDVDPTGAYVYTGARGGSTLNYHKVDTSTMTSVGFATALAGEANTYAGGILPGLSRGYTLGYASGAPNPVYMVEYDLGAGATPPTRLGSARMPESNTALKRFGVDAANGYAYLGNNEFNTRGRISKVAYFPGTDTPPEVRSTYEAPDTYGPVGQLQYDPIRDVMYGVTGVRNPPVTPGRFIKFAPGVGDAPPTEIYSFETGTTGYTLLCDFPNNHCYFISSSGVSKYDLGLGSNLPTFIGSLSLTGANANLRTVTLDTVNNKMYGIRSTFPSGIVKISLGTGATPPSLDGNFALDAGENDGYFIGVDPAEGYGVAFSFLPLGRLIRFTVDNTTNPPVRTGTETLPAAVYGGAFDPATDSGILFDQTQIQRVDFGGAAGPASITGYSDTGTQDLAFGICHFDGSDRLLISSGEFPSKFLKYSTTPAIPVANRLHSIPITLTAYTRVNDLRLYSHAAGGNFRFAILNGSYDVVWQSGEIANTVTGGELTIPISSGTPPTLVLPGAPGGTGYFLAFVTDSNTPSASFVPSTVREGLALDMEFGPFPTDIQGWTGLSFGSWTLYANGDPLPILSTLDVVDADGLNSPAPGYTNDTTVNVLTTYTGTAPTTIEISDDSFTTVASVAYAASVPFTMTTSTQGVKTIQARLVTAAGASGAVTDTITLDTVAPFSLISSSGVADGGITAAATNPFRLNFSFTESVALNGLDTSDSGDLTITNATAAAGSYSGADYDFIVTHGAPGAVTLQLLAGVATDRAGNLNTASNVFTYTFDNAPPVASLTLPMIKIGSPLLGTYTASDAHSAVTSVNMYRRKSDGVWGSAVALSGGTVSNNLVTGGTYYYAIRAVDSAGNANIAVPTGSSGTGSATVHFNPIANASVSATILGPSTHSFAMESTVLVTTTFPSVTGSGTLSVSRTEGDLFPTGFVDGTGLINERLNITPGGSLTFSGATLLANYEESNLGGVNEADITKAIRDNAGVTSTLPVTVDTVNNSVSVTGISQFSQWYFGAANASVDEWSLHD